MNRPADSLEAVMREALERIERWEPYDALSYGACQIARDALKACAALTPQPPVAERTRALGSSQEEQAAAWEAVFETLDELAPGWWDCSGVGMDKACETIRRLATPTPAVPDAVRGLVVDEAMVERAAIGLWHRFAPESHIEWADETHKAEYRMAACDLLTAALSATPEAPHWGNLPDDFDDPDSQQDGQP